MDKKIIQRIKQYERCCCDDVSQDKTLENICRRNPPPTIKHSSKKCTINFRDLISCISRVINSYIHEMLSALKSLFCWLKNGTLSNSIYVFILLFCSICMLFYSATNVSKWVMCRNELLIAYDNNSKDTLYVRSRQFENLGNKSSQFSWQNQWLKWQRDEYNFFLEVEKMPISYLTSRIYGIDSLLFFDSPKTSVSRQFSEKQSITDSILRNISAYGVRIKEGVGWHWMLEISHYHHYGRLDKISMFPYQVIIRNVDTLSIEQIYAELDSAYRFFTRSVESPFINFINPQNRNNKWDEDFESIINERLSLNNPNILLFHEIMSEQLYERHQNKNKDEKKLRINDYSPPILGYWYDKHCIVILSCSVVQQSAVISPQEFDFKGLGRLGTFVAMVCAMVITIFLLKQRYRNGLKLPIIVCSTVLVMSLLALAVIKYDEKQIKLQYRRHYYTDVGESTPPPFCEADSSIVGTMNDNGYFLRKIKVNNHEFSISDF